MRSLYKRYLYRLAISTPLWTFGALMVVLSFLGGLFSSGGFFAFFPRIAIILVPAFVSILPRPCDRLLLPEGDMTASFAETLALLSAESFFLLLSAPVTVFLQGSGVLETAAMLTGFLGLFLYLAAATAMCVFFFALIRHKGASFSVSALFLALFTLAHSAAWRMGMPRPVSSLLTALSFSWHEDAASKGILDSRDLIFYLSGFFFFVAASAASAQRQRGNGSLNFRRLIALSVCALILIVLDSNAFYIRLDLTRQRRFSVSPFSKTLLAEADAPLSICYYRTSGLRRLYSQVRDIEDFLRIYAASGRSLEYEILDPAGRGLDGRLESYGIRPQEIETGLPQGNGRLRAFSAITISYKGRTEVIPFILGTDTLEYELSGRIQALVRGTERRVRVIAGNGLSLDADYPYLAPWLTLQGFSVTEEDPSFLTSGKLCPDDMGECLLLLGSSDLSFSEAEAVCSYIDVGGRAFIATTPYTVDTGGDWSVSRFSDGLSQLLMKYGICLKDGMTASRSCLGMSLQLEGSGSSAEEISYPLWPLIPAQEGAEKGLAMFWPCAAELDGELAEEMGMRLEGVLMTEDGSWQYGPEGLEDETNPFSVPGEAMPGEEKGSFCIAACAYRGGRPALYVMGDQYALSARMMAFAALSAGVPDTRMLEFVSDSILRLEGQEELLKLKRPAPPMQGGQAPSYGKALLFCLILPLLLILALLISVKLARGRFVHRLELTLGKSS